MRFAVVGDPVGHSRSPSMHNAAYAVLGIDARYAAITVQAGGFGPIAEDLRSGALAGANVTMPLKDDAFDAVDLLAGSAEACRAVNTVLVRDGRLAGHNTDVDGVRHAVGRIPGDLEGPVLVLGSGGAARAAVVALEEHEIVVSSRNESTARRIIEDLGVRGRVVSWGTSVAGALVVNATPLGMHGEVLPAVVLEDASQLVDMPYGEHATPAIRTALDLGIPFSDGLDMLVGQAVGAFELFVGIEPPITVMEDAARGGRPRPGAVPS